jgi:NADH dehydrogenase
MKIAITGGTGFVGRNVARALVTEGHEVVLIARGIDRTDPTIRELPRTSFVWTNLEDVEDLARAFAGCDVVVHCAGINREFGRQTFHRIHVEGTEHVVSAARQAGVRKIILISFLRARPDCGSAYHESKWAAEQVVRRSGMDYTIFKCGVIYGRGDHMLNHLSHAFFSFPVFAFVGFTDKPIRPNAVEDVARLIKSAAVDGVLSGKTVAVVGPEELSLWQAVRRVAIVIRKQPLMFPMPLWFHYALAWLVERVMVTPLVSVAQVRMLSEGLSEPLPACESLPSELAPKLFFTDEQIRKGLPPAGPFGWADIRCCHGDTSRARRRRKIPFFEMP